MTAAREMTPEEYQRFLCSIYETVTSITGRNLNDIALKQCTIVEDFIRKIIRVECPSGDWAGHGGQNPYSLPSKENNQHQLAIAFSYTTGKYHDKKGGSLIFSKQQCIMRYNDGTYTDEITIKNGQVVGRIAGNVKVEPESLTPLTPYEIGWRFYNIHTIPALIDPFVAKLPPKPKAPVDPTAEFCHSFFSTIRAKIKDSNDQQGIIKEMIIKNLEACVRVNREQWGWRAKEPRRVNINFYSRNGIEITFNIDGSPDYDYSFEFGDKDSILREEEKKHESDWYSSEISVKDNAVNVTGRGGGKKRLQLLMNSLDSPELRSILSQPAHAPLPPAPPAETKKTVLAPQPQLVIPTPPLQAAPTSVTSSSVTSSHAHYQSGASSSTEEKIKFCNSLFDNIQREIKDNEKNPKEIETAIQSAIQRKTYGNTVSCRIEANQITIKFNRPAGGISVNEYTLQFSSQTVSLSRERTWGDGEEGLRVGIILEKDGSMRGDTEYLEDFMGFIDPSILQQAVVVSAAPMANTLTQQTQLQQQALLLKEDQTTENTSPKDFCILFSNSIKASIQGDDRNEQKIKEAIEKQIKKEAQKAHSTVSNYELTVDNQKIDIKFTRCKGEEQYQYTFSFNYLTQQAGTSFPRNGNDSFEGIEKINNIATSENGAYRLKRFMRYIDSPELRSILSQPAHAPLPAPPQPQPQPAVVPAASVTNALTLTGEIKPSYHAKFLCAIHGIMKDAKDDLMLTQFKDHVQKRHYDSPRAWKNHGGAFPKDKNLKTAAMTAIAYRVTTSNGFEYRGTFQFSPGKATLVIRGYDGGRSSWSRKEIEIENDKVTTVKNFTTPYSYQDDFETGGKLEERQFTEEQKQKELSDVVRQYRIDTIPSLANAFLVISPESQAPVVEAPAEEDLIPFCSSLFAIMKTADPQTRQKIEVAIKAQIVSRDPEGKSSPPSINTKKKDAIIVTFKSGILGMDFYTFKFSHEKTEIIFETQYTKTTILVENNLVTGENIYKPAQQHLSPQRVELLEEEAKSDLKHHIDYIDSPELRTILATVTLPSFLKTQTTENTSSKKFCSLFFNSIKESIQANPENEKKIRDEINKQLSACLPALGIQSTIENYEFNHDGETTVIKFTRCLSTPDQKRIDYILCFNHKTGEAVVSMPLQDIKPREGYVKNVSVDDYLLRQFMFFIDSEGLRDILCQPPAAVLPLAAQTADEEKKSVYVAPLSFAAVSRDQAAPEPGVSPQPQPTTQEQSFPERYIAEASAPPLSALPTSSLQQTFASPSAEQTPGLLPTGYDSDDDLKKQPTSTPSEPPPPYAPRRHQRFDPRWNREYDKDQPCSELIPHSLTSAQSAAKFLSDARRLESNIPGQIPFIKLPLDTQVARGRLSRWWNGITKVEIRSDEYGLIIHNNKPEFLEPGIYYLSNATTKWVRNVKATDSLIEHEDIKIVTIPEGHQNHVGPRDPLKTAEWIRKYNSPEPAFYVLGAGRHILDAKDIKCSKLIDPNGLEVTLEGDTEHKFAVRVPVGKNGFAETKTNVRTYSPGLNIVGEDAVFKGRISTKIQFVPFKKLSVTLKDGKQATIDVTVSYQIPDNTNVLVQANQKKAWKGGVDPEAYYQATQSAAAKAAKRYNFDEDTIKTAIEGGKGQTGLAEQAIRDLCSTMTIDDLIKANNKPITAQNDQDKGVTFISASFTDISLSPADEKAQISKVVAAIGIKTQVELGELKDKSSAPYQAIWTEIEAATCSAERVRITQLEAELESIQGVNVSSSSAVLSDDDLKLEDWQRDMHRLANRADQKSDEQSKSYRTLAPSESNKHFKGMERTGRNYKKYSDDIDIPCISDDYLNELMATASNMDGFLHFLPSWMTGRRVKKDEIGLIRVNGKPEFLAPGRYSYLPSSVEWIGVRKVGDKLIQHDSIAIANIRSFDERLYAENNTLCDAKGNLQEHIFLGVGTHVIDEPATTYRELVTCDNAVIVRKSAEELSRITPKGYEFFVTNKAKEKLDKNTDKKKIYLFLQNSCIGYSVLDARDNTVKGVLELKAPKPFTVGNLQKIEKGILEGIAKAGHIKPYSPELDPNNRVLSSIVKPDEALLFYDENGNLGVLAPGRSDIEAKWTPYQRVKTDVKEKTITVEAYAADGSRVKVHATVRYQIPIDLGNLYIATRDFGPNKRETEVERLITERVIQQVQASNFTTGEILSSAVEVKSDNANPELNLNSSALVAELKKDIAKKGINIIDVRFNNKIMPMDQEVVNANADRLRLLQQREKEVREEIGKDPRIQNALRADRDKICDLTQKVAQARQQKQAALKVANPARAIADSRGYAPSSSSTPLVDAPPAYQPYDEGMLPSVHNKQTGKRGR